LLSRTPSIAEQVLFVENEVRALILAFGLGLGLGLALALAASAQAAPLAPTPAAIELDVAPPLELVFGGYGSGWHRHYWEDRWGNLRRGRYVRQRWW
jgi:hypothetical protein